MSRIVRQILPAFLIACHTVVMLCGPCLHELPGATHHPTSAASKPHRSDDPVPSRNDSSDGCLICQFVAQGQLPVELSRESLPHLIGEFVLSALPVSQSLSNPLPSCPRAPPNGLSRASLIGAPLLLTEPTA
jgi:hypothetical protein